MLRSILQQPGEVDAVMTVIPQAHSQQRSQQGHSGTQGRSCLKLSLLIPALVLSSSCGLIPKLQPALASPGRIQDQADGWASTHRGLSQEGLSVHF